MSLSEKMSELFGKVSSGDIPTTRETTDDCFVHVFLGILNVWMSNGNQGALELAQEVDHLVIALKNKSDPLVKTFNAIERMTLFAGLNALTKQKESIHGSETQSSAASSDTPTTPSRSESA